LQISAEGYETIEKNVTIISGETVSLERVSLTKLTESLEPGEGLQIGSKAPDFELPDANGDTYSLSDYIGENKKVVIVFYRTGG
ncbi:redoxin domain-containing protein, partial [Candidatus Poribacteria bacterium]|nr:redoxin domain-containing protein [Candidatus Poribacteria bacterium]